MKNLFAVFLFVLIFSSLLFSQQALITKTGTTAASFLKIGSGARSVGMGGAFTAVSDDISAIYWNPAGLGNLQWGEASFHHVDWIADIKYDVASAVVVVDGFGVLGLSFTTMDVGEMEVTTTTMPDGTGEKFGAGATMISLSYGRSLTDKFSIGFNVKYIREYIWSENAQSVAFDFGTMYTAPLFDGVKIGASISNFGPKMRLEGRDILTLIKSGSSNENLINAQYEMGSYELPLLFRVGVASNLVNAENNRVTVAFDAIHPNDNTEYINSGIEYSWANIVSVRGGWKSAFERGGEQGLTLGIGLHYAISAPVEVIVDYAYQDFGRLKEVHYFSFGLRY